MKRKHVVTVEVVTDRGDKAVAEELEFVASRIRKGSFLGIGYYLRWERIIKEAEDEESFVD